MAAIEVNNGTIGCCYKPTSFDVILNTTLNLYFNTISYSDITETIDLRRLGENEASLIETQKYNDLLYLIIYLLIIKKQLLCDTTKTYLDFITEKEIQCFKDYFFCKDLDIECFIEKLGFLGEADE